MGGHVKKGEKGTAGIIYKPLVVDSEDGEGAADGRSKRTIPLMKTFYVYNLDQIEGLEYLRPQPPVAGPEFEPIRVAEELLAKSGAQILKEDTGR